jgi:hypothetical protein
LTEKVTDAEAAEFAPRSYSRSEVARIVKAAEAVIRRHREYFAPAEHERSQSPDQP